MQHAGWRSKSKEVSLLWREQRWVGHREPRKEGRRKGEQGDSTVREREFWQIISFSFELVAECFPVAKALHAHHFILPHAKPVRQTGQGYHPGSFSADHLRLEDVSYPKSQNQRVQEWDGSALCFWQWTHLWGRGTKKLHILRLAEHKPGLPWWLNGKESACNTGDRGPIPGSGRPPGEGNGHPLQYSFLGNPMYRGAWRATVHGVTESRTRLSD